MSQYGGRKSALRGGAPPPSFAARAFYSCTARILQVTVSRANARPYGRDPQECERGHVEPGLAYRGPRIPGPGGVVTGDGCTFAREEALRRRGWGRREVGGGYQSPSLARVGLEFGTILGSQWRLGEDGGEI